jgi:hypothetical protein
MTQMGITINGRTTNIHAHMRSIQWFKLFFFAGEGIINVKFFIAFISHSDY